MSSKPINFQMTPKSTEEHHQIALIAWANLSLGTYPELALLYHIPNGGKRGRSEARRFKAAGVKAGVPDLHLPVPVGRYHGLYIEMKKPGGRTSPEQEVWIGLLRRQGHRVAVCHGWEAARDVLIEYLGERDGQD